MSTKAKTAPLPAPKADEAFAKGQAALMTHAGVNAAAIIEKFSAAALGEPGMDAIVEAVRNSTDKLKDGSMRGCEAMLMGQAMALQSMFMSLSRRAASQEYLKQYETYLRLALKAQSQCRATLETLATIKNPQVVFAKQANIANGPQQVNNGVPLPPATSRGDETSFGQNKLLEAEHEKHMDTGTQIQAVCDHPAIAPVAKVDGSP